MDIPSPPRLLRRSTASQYKRATFRSLNGWAISILLETHSIRECEEHGWMRDRSDPHAREQAFTAARQDPPPGVSPEQAVSAVRDALNTIGDACPECPPRDDLSISREW